MHTQCPNCRALVVQTRNRDGPNFCSRCYTLFDLPEKEKMPPWILGVLVFLTANLQLISQH